MACTTSTAAALPTESRQPKASTSNASDFLTPGQLVEVRSKARSSRGTATVVEGPVHADDSEHPYHGRYQVRYNDGASYYCRPETLRPLQQPPSRIVVCDTTLLYRDAAYRYAHPQDIVLEVGCHEGVTTAALTQRCAWVVGIDKSWDPVARARAKYPGVRFEQVDGFDLAALQALNPTNTFTKIFIDIGGIAELHIVMSMVGLYFRTFKRATLVVKSRFLKALMGQVAVHSLPPQGPTRAPGTGRRSGARGGARGGSGQGDGLDERSACGMGGAGQASGARQLPAVDAGSTQQPGGQPGAAGGECEPQQGLQHAQPEDTCAGEQQALGADVLPAQEV